MNSKHRNECGATYVEFTIAGILFFLFILITVDLLLMSLNVLSVQFIATDVMRSAVVLAPESVTNQYNNKAEYIVDRLISRANGLGVSLDEQDIRVYTLDDRNRKVKGAGDAGKPIFIEIATPMQGILSGTNLPIFKNLIGDFSISTTILSTNELYSE